jgi:hypothetical protein
MGASKLRPIDIGVPGSDVYGVIGTPADKCEAKIDAEWRVIGIADALGMYKGALRRCIECHGPMRLMGRITMAHDHTSLTRRRTPAVLSNPIHSLVYPLHIRTLCRKLCRNTSFMRTGL